VLVEAWLLLVPVIPSMIFGAVIATARWKKFVADMIAYQMRESLKRPDLWTEQMARQRLTALALTIDGDPEFKRRALHADESKG